MELEKWGAVFDRTKDGKINQRNFGGHRYPRLAHVGDRTGLEIIRTVQDKVIHQENVEILMECTVAKIFTEGNQVRGALAYYRNNGKLVAITAKSIVIATGGIEKAYRVTSNSWVHWRWTFIGIPFWRGFAGYGIYSVPSNWNGLAT